MCATLRTGPPSQVSGITACPKAATGKVREGRILRTKQNMKHRDNVTTSLQINMLDEQRDGIAPLKVKPPPRIVLREGRRAAGQYAPARATPSVAHAARAQCSRHKRTRKNAKDMYAGVRKW